MSYDSKVREKEDKEGKESFCGVQKKTNAVTWFSYYNLFF